MNYEVALTTEWVQTNARRHTLIDLKQSRALTDEESAEFRELQWLAGLKRELLSGPLPEMPQPGSAISHCALCEDPNFIYRDCLLAAQSRGSELQREVDAKIAEAMRPTGGRTWTDEQNACFNALTDCAETIRANKQQ